MRFPTAADRWCGFDHDLSNEPQGVSVVTDDPFASRGSGTAFLLLGVGGRRRGMLG
jgi:hypothetical protein